MTVTLGINGFGRIGRCTLAHITEAARNDVQVVRINATGPIETNAHLLKYDSVHGRFGNPVTVKDNTIDLGRGPIDVMSLAKVLNDAIGIERGIMTTIHSYTGDQPTLDRRHSDLYRARAAAMAMIPTSTGAAKALGEVLPELSGKLDGTAIRVPTPNVSAVDLTFEASKSVTAADVNAIMAEAAGGYMGMVMAYDAEAKVSIDFNHTTQSCIFAPDQTKVIGGKTVRVLAWYDNEWGFSARMADVAAAMGRLH